MSNLALGEIKGELPALRVPSGKGLCTLQGGIGEREGGGPSPTSEPLKQRSLKHD